MEKDLGITPTPSSGDRIPCYTTTPNELIPIYDEITCTIKIGEIMTYVEVTDFEDIT